MTIPAYRIPTEDPTTFITGFGPQWIRYWNTDGKRWEITGTCAACGLCEVGANNPNLVWTGNLPGTPGACLDRTYRERRDIPVTPLLMEKEPRCTLRGRWLHGH